MQQNNIPLIVGRIGGVYGIKGWLKISSFTRPNDNILSYAPWLLAVDGIWQEINLEESQKRGERLLVKILGIDNPEDASQYINCDIAIRHEQLPTLEKGEYYWRDLIGLKVLNQDEVVLGVISEIIETGANDVFVVTGCDENKVRILIPSVMGVYINKIDLIAQTICVDWAIDD
jgi:16S rRNA processing protein RimM